MSYLREVAGPSAATLQSYLGYYNDERAHTGCPNQGRNPSEIVYGASKMHPR